MGIDSGNDDDDNCFGSGDIPATVCVELLSCDTGTARNSANNDGGIFNDKHKKERSVRKKEGEYL